MPVDPQPPNNASDASKQLQALSGQAEVLTEQYKKAQDDRAARQADVDRATADIAQAEKAGTQARAEEERFRGEADRFTHAAFQGAQMNQMSALLVSKSPREYLDRASAVEVLAKDRDDVVQRLATATAQATASQRQAEDARNRAAQAEADAGRIEGEMAGKKAAMDAQIAKAKQQYNSLSAKEKAALNGGDDTAGLVGGSGAAIAAVNAALGKQGSPYVWGATGPSEFDCSGLTQWAYKQVGISLPRSTYSQQNVGQSVSESDLRPGDLMFFNGSEHEGIYIGGGKVVHAPTEGENVKVTTYKYIGSVNAIRRVAG